MEVYWDIELMIADEDDAPWSEAWLSAKDERACALCGHVCETTQFGDVPTECEDKQCQAVRSFWKIHGNVTEFSRFGGDRARSAYLRSRMNGVLGVSALREIAREIRFEFLLNTMIERLAHEHQQDNGRAQRHAVCRA